MLKLSEAVLLIRGLHYIFSRKKKKKEKKNHKLETSYLLIGLARRAIFDFIKLWTKLETIHFLIFGAVTLQKQFRFSLN